MQDLKFKTPSNKIELVSSRLEKNGIPSFKPYESPEKPGPGFYRLAFGRSPVHNHGNTQNNPILSEIMPENQLWINAAEAQKMDISNGDVVEVTSADGSHSGTIQAYVTEFIDRDSVFMVHGFGRKVPWQTRGYNKGLGDYRFETGLLGNYDPVGGANALMECFVNVKKAS
jgi:thiosulfate reductase/polysulfide reductase chain A